METRVVLNFDTWGGGVEARDGRRIAFVRRRRLWTIDSDGGAVRKIRLRGLGKRLEPFATTWGVRSPR